MTSDSGSKPVRVETGTGSIEDESRGAAGNRPTSTTPIPSGVVALPNDLELVQWLQHRKEDCARRGDDDEERFDQLITRLTVVPSDVARLVVAARKVAFEDAKPEAIRELDQASEAFAGDVPWDDEPAALTTLKAPTQEVERLREALRAIQKLERSITCDVGTAHSLRGPGASSEMRSDDRDMRAEMRHAFGLVQAALASTPSPVSGEQSYPGGRTKEEWDAAVEAARLRHAQASPVSDRVLVPREPSPAMTLAGDAAYRNISGSDRAQYGGLDGLVVAYRAMIAAAQASPVSDQEMGR